MICIYKCESVRKCFENVLIRCNCYKIIKKRPVFVKTSCLWNIVFPDYVSYLNIKLVTLLQFEEGHK